jgi:hypothetical protein
MKWQRAKEGYYQIDHRFSPGTDAVPGGMNYESATATCAHCSGIVVLNPNRSRPRNYCRACDDFICDGCAVKRKCRPFKQVIDDELRGIYQKIRGGIL